MKRMLRLLILICLITFPSVVRAQLFGTITSSSALSGCDSLCAVFRFNVTSGCTGSVTTVWTYENAATHAVVGTNAYGSFCFNAIGTYNVSVQVTCNATGETRTFTQPNYVTVHSSPVVNFTTSDPGADTILSCGPHPVHFINTSNADTASGCAFSWSWVITGGGRTLYFNTSSIDNTFTAPGTYDVSLTYFARGCGCFGTVTKHSYIKIQAPPVACFDTASPSIYCHAPAVVSYDAGCSSGATTYAWSFDDGSVSGRSASTTTTHTYFTPGYHSDTLTAYSSAGCPTRTWIDRNIFIGNFHAHQGIPSDTVICLGGTATFRDSIHASETDHAATYKFILKNAATGASVDSVSSNPASFTFGASTGAGLFYVDEVAADSAGCVDVARTSIRVNAAPVVGSITGDTLYRCTAPLNVRFTSTVTAGASSALTYRWSFGDGTTLTGSPLTSTSHRYVRDSSSFNVKLVVTDANGCADSLTHSAYVNIGRPSVAVSISGADSGCATAGHPLHVPIHISVTPTAADLSTLTVSYDDGTAPCVGLACSDTSHDFGAGTHHIYVHWQMPAYQGGCSGDDTATVLAGGVPPMDSLYFSADSVCPNTNVLFYANCSNCNYVHWHINTSATSATDTASDSTSSLFTAYGPTSGTRHVQLVMSAGGCRDTVDTSIYVFPPYANAITPRTVNCARRDTVQFTLQGAIGAVRYVWSFGDGTGSVTTTTSTVTHGFRDTSPHLIICTSIASAANHNCTWTDTLLYSTAPVPLVWRTDSTIYCVGATATFFGPRGTDRDSTPFTDYYWYFADGSTPSPVHTSQAVEGVTDWMTTHRYNITGTFHPIVVIRDGSGCRDTSSRLTISVLGPSGGISVSDTLACVGSTVNFRDLNTDPSGTIRSPRYWFFNGAPGVRGSRVPSTAFPFTGTTANYTFNDTGRYIIRLNDTTYGSSCSNSSTATVHVVKPVAYFYSPQQANANKWCKDLPISFRSTNTNCSYSWNFGDVGPAVWTTASASDSIISHTYTVNGTYTVRLRVVANGTAGYPAGCSDTMVRVAYVKVQHLDLSSTNFGDDTISTCPPLYIVRYADTPGYSYLWNVYPPGGSPISFGGPFLRYAAFSSGHYNVTLIGTTSWGCTDSVSQGYVIGGPAGYITVAPDSGCNPIPIRLEFHDTGVVAASSTYIWNSCPFGSFTTSRSDTTVYYSSPGVYCPPTVTIQSGACAVTINYFDSLRVFPLPFVSVSHMPVLCYGRDTTLIATSTIGVDHYNWTSSIPSSITYTHPIDGAFVTIHPTATATYTVTAFTDRGCTDTESVTITVDPQLFLHIAGRDSVCIGLCDTLIASGVAGASYVWAGVGVACAVCDTNIVCITSTKIFTASATDAAGCSASNTFKVTVNPAPVLSYKPNPAYICKGYDTTRLHVSGAASYYWKTNVHLSCDSCANPICSTPTNLVYTVTGVSKFGCIDSIKVPVTVYDTNATVIGSDTSICKGTSAHLYVRGGIAYTWVPTTGLDDPHSDAPYATPDETTRYRVYIKENLCFKDTQYVTVTVIPLPRVRLPQEVTVLSGTSVQLYADTLNHVFLTDYTWTPSDSTLSCIHCPRPLATPIVTTTYSVTVATQEGCSGSGTVTIKVLCDNSQVFIPNTFTPNGDGVNDQFYVSGRGLGKVTRMAIYNRWGELVYESTGTAANDGGAGWDGTYKGQALAPDVFVYKIDVVCSTGEPFSFQGDISLVR